MRVWEIKEDSENKDYQNLPPHSRASEARYIARGVGTPKFLLYRAKDYNQIVGLRWELTDEFDPLNPEHTEHAYAIDITEPVFKLWNETLDESKHIDYTGKSMSQYIGSLSNEQIDDIFNNYLSDEANTDFGYSNIDTPQQFLRFQNTGNSERSVFLFEGTLIYNSINKQVIE
tara:strand:+ start:49 stop:567 length:519 start_codon:yes stop_codon:yes gene_type:complete